MDSLKCGCRPLVYLLTAVGVIFSLVAWQAARHPLRQLPASLRRRILLTSDDLAAFQSGHVDMEHPVLLEYIRGLVVGPSRKALNLRDIHRRDFSQANQSRTIDRLLGGLRGGFFLECGAGNGESLSNTLFLERERNWTGLLVEANPLLFSRILGKHRNAYVINACLSPTAHPQLRSFRLQSVLGGLMGDGYKTSGSGGGTGPAAAVQPVQCFPVFSLLAALRVRRVHYLSLDVEGAELDILRTIPWRRLRIDTLSVEYSVTGSRGRDVDASLRRLDAIRRLLGDTGLYEEAAILSLASGGSSQARERQGLDVVFKRRDLQ